MIVLIGICLSVFADNKTNKEIKGDKYYFVYSFDEAIIAYENAKNLSTEGVRRLALCYHHMAMNVKSEETYHKLVALPEGVISEDYFNYAMILKTNNKYELSHQWMDKFCEENPKDLRALDYQENKKNLQDYLTDKGDNRIENLRFNTSAEEFAPVYYKDKMVYASSGSNPNPMKKTFNWNGKPFINMYVTELDGDQFVEPEIFGQDFNLGMHDGPATFSKDGNYMAFSRNNYDLKRKDRVVRIELCFSSYVDGEWTEAEQFYLNNDNYSVGLPCLSSDGKSMYFVSDMPGGYGKGDIYHVSKNDDGTWGKAENLGDKINTEGDELFPFFEENSSTLFFSSNGRFGLGGADIFIAEIKGSDIGSVQNAGSPINSRYDDFSLVVDSEMKSGYLSSNRATTRDDDIYHVNLSTGQPTDSFELANNEPNEMTNNETDEMANSNPNEMTNNETTIPVQSKIGKNEVLIVDDFNINTIYFDFGKSDIRPESKKILEDLITIMNNNPSMTLTISGYTDCRSTEVFNQKLSNQRAMAPTRYIKSGISNPNRITSIGYGETKLTNDCSCKNEVVSECSESEHQDNRRTTLIFDKENQASTE